MQVTPNKAGKQTRSTGLTLAALSNFESLETLGYTRLADSPDVAMAVGRLADMVSDATIYLMHNTKAGDERVKNELSKFMDIHPYSLGTRKTLINWITSYMFLEGDGNAVVLPKTDGGYLTDMRPLPGAQLVPVDNGLSYYVQWRGIKLLPDEVLHFPLRPDLYYPWRGRGVRIPLKDVLGNLKQSAATTKAFLSDKWKPSVIVKVDAMADEFDSEAGRDKLLDQYIANQEAGKPWIIPSELMDIVQVKPLSLADLAIADNVQLDKRTVAATIGVPPYFVGVGNFSKDEYNNCVRTTCRTLTNIICNELTNKLLLSPDMYFKSSQRSLYAYDLKELSEIADNQYVCGLMTGNEVRDWLDMSPVDGLDERVILENYIPAGMIGDQKKLDQKGDKTDE